MKQHIAELAFVSTLLTTSHAFSAVPDPRFPLVVTPNGRSDVSSLYKWNGCSVVLTLAVSPFLTVSPRTKSASRKRLRSKKSPMVDSALLRFQKQRAPSKNDWMKQFRRSTIVDCLKSYNVDTDVARKAADVVYETAKRRNERRMLRQFLKERETVFSEQFHSDALPQTSNTIFERNLNLFKEYGLTGKDMAEILIHTPSLAFKKDLSTVPRILHVLLIDTLGLRKYDARKVLRNAPGLLTNMGSQNALGVVDLMTSLGVSSNSLSRDKNALVVLLQRQPAALFRLVAFLSSDAIRMPVDQIGPLLRKHPDILDSVAPILSPTSLIERQVQTAIVNERYETMTQTAWILRYEIGTKDLGKVISSYPSVLLLDAYRQILPIARYLMELGIWEDDLPKVLQLYPRVLRLDLEQIKNTVAYLESLEVTEFASIFRSFPYLLTVEVERNMEPVVNFLRDIGIVNIGRFITRLPPVLNYNVETELIPKFEYLKTIKTDPRYEISKFPAYFSYPLQRVQARFEYLYYKRLASSNVSVEQVLCNGDADFAVNVAGDLDGTRFAQFIQWRQDRLSKQG